MSEFKLGGVYQAAYRKAYEFHQRHHGASTDQQWQAAADELANFNGSQFEQALAIAIYAEIEREAKTNERK